jgi:hypothetical protein
VSINGENWWDFQYTTALAGYTMDDWLRSGNSTQPEVDERLSYAAKLANVGAINSGQIDSNAANIGTVAWTYQAMKGNESDTINYADVQDAYLHNDWWQMSGEADLGLFGAVRILSSDVAVDPIFGVIGYGCDVTQSGTVYSVTPRDGVFKRLNLITERLHVELDRDTYTAAQLDTAKNYLQLTLNNQETSAAHTTTITLVGFAAGSYPVVVNGTQVGTVTVTSGQTASVPISVGTSASYTIVVGTAP